MNPDTKSHVIYTEEDLVRLSWRDFSISVTLVLVSIIFMYLISPLSYLTFLSIFSVGILLFRIRYVLFYMRELRVKGKVTFIPKKSTSKKRNAEDRGFLLAEVFLPLILLFLLPVPLNLVAALGFVIGIPFSLILEVLVVRGLESKVGDKIKKYFVWSVINDDLYLKEFGYLLSRNSQSSDR